MPHLPSPSTLAMVLTICLADVGASTSPVEACGSRSPGGACELSVCGRALPGLCLPLEGDGPLACLAVSFGVPAETTAQACAGLRAGGACAVDVGTCRLEGRCRASPGEGLLRCAPASAPASGLGAP